MSLLGITFAFIALLSWGFGDYFIQATSRAVGIVKALFYIGFGATILLLPFVYNQIGLVFQNPRALILLGLAAIIAFFASLFDFEALKEGKISIIEPIIGFELPITVGLGIIFFNEKLSPLQLTLIVTAFIGIVLAVTNKKLSSINKKHFLEKGIALAGVGAIGMALTNFIVGVSSNEITPVLTIWFIHSLLGIFCLVYLLGTGQFTVWNDFKKHKRIIIGEAVLDNLAWVSYAAATTFIPISITTAISESYVALAAFLGISYNREKLISHQYIGIFIIIVSVITLSVVSS